MIAAADLPLLADGAILINIGHFPLEIDLPGIEADDSVVGRARAADGIETFTLADGRRIHLLTGATWSTSPAPGRSGTRLTMDLGFALQARCLERARGRVSAAEYVVPVPRAV